jgi:hypothetical protein
MAPLGSVEGEISKLQSVIDTWVQKLSSGKLSCQDMWIALNSTIFRTLSYPLPVLNLTRQQWESLLKPLLKFALPSLGVCHHYPRSLVFAPEGVFGIGLPHLYTCQEIACLKDMVLHTTNNTTTRALYRSSLELLHIELGSFLPLSMMPYDKWAILTTSS